MGAVNQQEPSSAKEFLSRRELAARWGVSIETIKRRERAGILKPMHFSGRLVRHKLADVLRAETHAQH